MRVEGQFVFNGTALMLDAALSGFDLAYVPEDVVQAHLADGRLIRVLGDWCPPYPGYHLYSRAAVNPRQGLCCWSMRCVTEAEGGRPPQPVIAGEARPSTSLLRR